MKSIYDFIRMIPSEKIISSCCSISDQLGKSIDCIRLFHRYFTSHGLIHSIHILKRILELNDKLLNKKRLNEVELSILYGACFLHDIGMLPTKDDLEFIVENRDYSDRIAQRMQHIRQHHGAKNRIHEHFSSINPDLSFMNEIDQEYYIELVKEICSKHTDKSDFGKREKDLPDKDQLNGKSIRPKLLSRLFRFSDELNVGRERSLPTAYYAFGILPREQEFEHFKHLILDDVQLKVECNTLLIILKFNPGHVSNVRLLQQMDIFLKKIEKEFNAFKDVINLYFPDLILTLKFENMLPQLDAVITALNALRSEYEEVTLLDDTCNTAVDKIYKVKEAYEGSMRFLIVSDPRNADKYATRDCIMCMRPDQCRIVSNEELDRDIFISSKLSPNSIFELSKYFYPDLYVIDFSNTMDIQNELLNRVSYIVYSFCSSEKQYQGRISPFIVFVDNNKDRLVGTEIKVYQQLLSNLEKELHRGEVAFPA